MKRIALTTLVVLLGIIAGCKKQDTLTSNDLKLELKTMAISNLTLTSAASGGAFVSYGKDSIMEKGVCWATSENPTVSGNKTSDGSGSGNFVSSMIGLTPITYYFVRAYATTKSGTVYGTQVKFITSLTPYAFPVVTTTAITNITNTSAQSGGNVTTDSGSAIIARGVCWSTSHNPTIADSKTTNGIGTGVFTSIISGLTPNTTYYVRAYATNGAGTSYGNEFSLTTTNVTSSPPTVITSPVTGISSDHASSGGDVTSQGGSTVISRGVCWATHASPTLADNLALSGTGTGSFNSAVTGLSANTTYYVRAFATNSAGTSYGNEVTFITTSAIIPTLTTTAMSSITATTASSGGNISSDGGSTVTARGVCWSTTPAPTTANNKTINGTGTGSFSSSLTGLVSGTTYYVRAYATNGAGTAYGNEINFTTTSTTGTLATLTTSMATSILSNAASSGGNISSDGGSTVTVRGVCWNTTGNPTTANSKTIDGAGTGSFTSVLSGLSPNTIYYVRAYATNSIGTAYGNQVSFTTTAVSSCGSTVTDIDGNTYNIVQIGTQCWTRENLKVTKYANGDAIPNVTDDTQWSNQTAGAYCYHSNSSSNGATYGALYNWFVTVDSRNVCPTGWHVPTETEMTTLINYAGGLSLAGTALKESGTSHWVVGSNPSTNSTGFTGLPGSFRNSAGAFITTFGAGIGYAGLFWTSTIDNVSPFYLQLNFYSDGVSNSSTTAKESGQSIRCLKN